MHSIPLPHSHNHRVMGQRGECHGLWRVVLYEEKKRTCIQNSCSNLDFKNIYFRGFDLTLFFLCLFLFCLNVSCSVYGETGNGRFVCVDRVPVLVLLNIIVIQCSTVQTRLFIALLMRYFTHRLSMFWSTGPTVGPLVHWVMF